MIPNPWLLLAGILALAGAFIGGELHGRHAEGLEWQVKIDDQKQAAAKTLLDETNKARAEEAAAGALNTQTESKHAHDLQTRNDQLAGALAAAHTQRLRDPGRRDSGDCAQGQAAASASGSDGAAGGSELSPAAADFLLRFASRCDQVVDQYLGAQKYAVELWKLCTAP